MEPALRESQREHEKLQEQIGNTVYAGVVPVRKDGQCVGGMVPEVGPKEARAREPRCISPWNGQQSPWLASEEACGSSRYPELPEGLLTVRIRTRPQQGPHLSALPPSALAPFSGTTRSSLSSFQGPQKEGFSFLIVQTLAL